MTEAPAGSRQNAPQSGQLAGRRARAGLVAVGALTAALAFVVPAGGAGRNRPAPIFRGDFDTGDLSQWHAQRAAESRIGVVRRPRIQGRYAARFTVRPNDVVNPGLGTGHRAEVYARGSEDGYPDGEGTVRYYGWCTFLPRKFKPTDNWEIISQWKNAGSGSPPVYMRLQKTQLYLMAENDAHNAANTVWTSPISLGRWHRFVLRTKYGTTSETGSLKLWYDGKLALPLTPRSTMLFDRRTGGGLPNYWKLGLYRSAAVEFRQTVYHDGAFVGRSYRSVARC